MLGFPYYIVRFKHTYFFSVFSPKKFPYYIVRFKLLLLLGYYDDIMSFHTTQYDLNSTTYTLPGNNEGEFPYYIVRFKHAIFFFSSIISFSCFHTTQYDLNLRHKKQHKRWIFRFHTTQYDLNIVFFSFVKYMSHVSILHSTI